MDGDRPVVDGRDIFESKLQELIRDAIEEAWDIGVCYGFAEEAQLYEKYDRKIHELIVSHLDSPSGNVGAQDEASEEGEMGDGVRSKSYLIPRDPNAFIVDEWDPIRAIDDKFAREMGLRFAQEGKKVAMGHCDLTKLPDGSIHARMKFFPQNPR